MESPLAALTAACEALVTLAERPPKNHAVLFHQACARVHDVSESLLRCEAAAYEHAELRQLVDGARRVHAESPFIKRLQEWPRGYPGDFETIEWLYHGSNRAVPGTLGHALETIALTFPVGQQHRNRIAFQARAVLDAITSTRWCRVLSLACGGSLDLRSILPALRSAPDSQFVLCDADPEALRFCETALADIAERCTFICGAVPTVLGKTRALRLFDLIIIGGLFDNLPDRVVSRVLSIAWNELLAPNGRLVFTNMARGNPFRPWLEYLADWPLMERSEADIKLLCADAGIDEAVEITRDATGLSLLVSVSGSGAARFGADHRAS